MDTKDIKQAEGDGHDVPFKWWIWAIIGVVVLWVLSAILISAFSEEGFSMGERGTFGDMFGAVNALFSGLAFATLIYTVLQQRAELKATRAEMQQQSQEWVKQNAVLSLQAFEGSFFQMLRMLEEAAKSVFLQHERFMSKGFWDKQLGDQAFELFVQEIAELRAYTRDAVTDGEATELGIMKASIGAAMEKYGTGFFRYLDALTNVAGFVVKSSLAEKKIYAQLMRSQMSNEQLQFVFYVCMTGGDYLDLRQRLDRLNFFESLPTDLFIHPCHPVIYYDAEDAS